LLKTEVTIACELISGNGSFPKDTDKGLKLLNIAAELGSSGACMTIAKFHDKGEFGYKQSIESRDKFPIFSELTMKFLGITQFLY